MGIKVNIHKTHRNLTNGLDVVEVEGNTVGECLDRLIKRFPHMKEGLFDKNGKLRNVVEIYVNQQSTYPEELAKKVEDGDSIHLTIILAGG